MMRTKMSSRTFLVPTCLVLFSFTSFFLISCGGGGGDGGDTASSTSNSGGYVVLEGNTATRVDYSPTTVYGEMFAPDEYTCDYCPPTGPEMSVTWANLTTGETGQAWHGYKKDQFYTSCICLGSWSADIPLTYGDNQVKIRAEVNSGSYGEDDTIITRVPGVAEEINADAVRDGVMVTWKAVPGAVSYDLHWSNSASFDQELVLANVTSPYLHGGLTKNLTYYYRVIAKINDFSSSESESDWATAGWIAEDVGYLEPTEFYAWEGPHTSIAVDRQGQVHINSIYETRPTETSVLSYSTYSLRSGGVWENTDLGHPSQVDANISVDAAENIHIANVNFDDIAHYFQESSGLWSSDVVDSASYICNIAMSQDDQTKLHIAYVRQNGEVYYVNDVNGDWETTLLEKSLASVSCRDIAIEVDSMNRIHVAYVDSSQPLHKIVYATNKTGSWLTQSFDSGNYITSMSMDLDSDSSPFIVYASNTGEFKYAWLQNSLWSISLFPDDGSFPEYPNVEIDEGGNAHIAYYDYGKIYYMSDQTGQWVRIPVGRGTGNAITVDSDGYVHISYIYVSGRALKYVTNR